LLVGICHLLGRGNLIARLLWAGPFTRTHGAVASVGLIARRMKSIPETCSGPAHRQLQQRWSTSPPHHFTTTSPASMNWPPFSWWQWIAITFFPGCTVSRAAAVSGTRPYSVVKPAAFVAKKPLM
jgi:hypothetical protein